MSSKGLHEMLLWSKISDIVFNFCHVLSPALRSAHAHLFSKHSPVSFEFGQFRKATGSVHGFDFVVDSEECQRKKVKWNQKLHSNLSNSSQDIPDHLKFPSAASMIIKKKETWRKGDGGDALSIMSVFLRVQCPMTPQTRRKK